MEQKSQYIFIKMISQLMNKGYHLEEALDYVAFVEPKVAAKMKSAIKEAIPLSELFKQLHFKGFVVEMLEIGQANHQVGEALKQIISQFDFLFLIKKEMTRLLIYPLVMFVVALISFEFLRLTLYPTILTLLTDFKIEPNQKMTFLAFHLLKMIVLAILAIFVVFNRFPRLGNAVKIMKLYRSLFLCNQMRLLLMAGLSVEETFLSISKKSKHYRLNELQSIVLTDRPLAFWSGFDSAFVSSFKLGLHSNQLYQSLTDFEDFYLQVVTTSMSKLIYVVQFGLLVILSVNIFLMYIVIMLPMFELSYQL